MNAYLKAMLDAALAGCYVPEVEVMYCKYDDFKVPHVRAVDLGQ